MFSGLLECPTSVGQDGATIRHQLLLDVANQVSCNALTYRKVYVITVLDDLISQLTYH